VDLSKLKISDWLVGGGTIAFLISLALPWYKVDAFGFSVSAKGYDYTIAGLFSFLLLAGAFVVLVLPKLADGVKIPDPIGPVSRLQAGLILAGLAFVIVLLRIIFKDDGGAGGDADDFIDRGIGLFLAVIAAGAATAGAFMKYSGKEPDEAGPASSGPATPF
jgi:hypothetical protein